MLWKYIYGIKLITADPIFVAQAETFSAFYII